MGKTLTRSKNNRWIAGVCGGIAEYTGIPAIFIRLLWVVLCIYPIPIILGLLLYIAAWYFIPEEPNRKKVADKSAIDVEYEVKE